MSVIESALKQLATLGGPDSLVRKLWSAQRIFSLGPLDRIEAIAGDLIPGS